MSKAEPRFLVRFNEGQPDERTTEKCLPYDRARRVALRGISSLGIFQGGTAELLLDGETFEWFAELDN